MTTATVQYPAPKRIDMVIERDADTAINFVLTDTVGHPVDITADTVQFTARDTYAGTAKIATISNTTTHHTDPTNGSTTFTISKAVVDAAAATNRDEVWLYEVRRIVGGSGAQTIYATGELRVRPAVTAG